MRAALTASLHHTHRSTRPRRRTQFGSGPAPGARAPEAKVSDDPNAIGLFGFFQGTHHTLLLFDGASATAEGYATLMGKLAMPSLMVQALAPSVGAMILQASGTESMLSALVIIAGVNLAATGLLLGLISSRKLKGAWE